MTPARVMDARGCWFVYVYVIPDLIWNLDAGLLIDPRFAAGRSYGQVRLLVLQTPLGIAEVFLQPHV